MTRRALPAPPAAPAPTGGRPARVFLARAAAAAVLACLPACASVPGGVAAQGIEGCWYFEMDAAAASLRLPMGIRLTATPLENWPSIMRRGDVRVAVTVTRQGDADYPFGYWLREGGRVEVGYPGGGGVVLDLAPGRSTLEGTARAVGDARRPGEMDRDEPADAIRVRLERRSCESA